MPDPVLTEIDLHNGRQVVIGNDIGVRLYILGLTRVKVVIQAPESKLVLRGELKDKNKE